MKKLTEFKNGKIINNKLPFREGLLVCQEYIQLSIKFAEQMVFGDGFQRKYRSGGSKIRNDNELFINIVQGKISEFVLKEYFEENGLKCSEVDLHISPKGEWDNGDLIVNNKLINVKSMAFFSNLLLLEKNDWGKGGIYLKNTKYDYFVAVRIKPNLKDFLYKENISELLLKTEIYFDIAGVISNNSLDFLIDNNYIIKKGETLNEKTTLDADNIYIQCGDLFKIEKFINKIKNL